VAWRIARPGEFLLGAAREIYGTLLRNVSPEAQCKVSDLSRQFHTLKCQQIVQGPKKTPLQGRLRAMDFL
jgi:hypothetical protein